MSSRPDVIDIGCSYADDLLCQHRLHARWLCDVTLHNPATINGLKWMLGDRPPTPEEVAALERGVKKGIADDGRTRGVTAFMFRPTTLLG